MPLVRGNLIFELANFLPRVRQRVSFAIEGFHAMTAHAASLIEEVLGEVQRVRALRYAIVRVAHLAAGFGVVPVIERMQPEWIQSVRFLDRRSRPAVATVTSRATKLFGIMNLQQLFTRMADKCVSEIVRFFPGTTRSHVCRRDSQRLARAEVTNLTTIDDAELVDVKLMAKNRVVKSALVLSDQIIDILLR